VKIRLPGCVAFALVIFLAGLWQLEAAPALAQDAATAAAAQPTLDVTAWRQELEAWRAQRAREVAAPDGWLTLAGMEWLKPGGNSFGAGIDNQILVRAQAPNHMGVLVVSGGPPTGQTDAPPQTASSAVTIQLVAPAGGFPPDMTLNGVPAHESQLVLNDVRPATIGWHGVTLTVLPRGDRFALRIRDSDSPIRAGFHGLNWYAPNPHFRVTAHWTPYDPPRIEKIPTGIETTLDLPAPGIAEFTLDGQTLRLEPVIEDREGKTLFFILHDATNEITTYGDGRFFTTGLPDQGLDKPGTLTLDFNRIENPACAYTRYATCPQPPDQNELPVALEAGEKEYMQ
jgi:uncharacterized protein (DUF1684 family)